MLTVEDVLWDPRFGRHERRYNATDAFSEMVWHANSRKERLLEPSDGSKGQPEWGKTHYLAELLEAIGVYGTATSSNAWEAVTVI